MDTILQEFRDEILNNVNAKECARELRIQEVIAETTETDIERARDARMACIILYNHLRKNCIFKQIVVLARVLMEVDSGLGKTREVGQRLYARIQGVDASGTDQKVDSDEPPLHPSAPKTEAHTGNNYMYSTVICT